MMNTGMVRKLGEMGRIILPKEIRKTFDIDVGDSLEIFLENKSIVLKKYNPACVFCGEAKAVTDFKRNNICPSCLTELRKNE